MQKILLCSQVLGDARVIKNYIETELPYEVLLSFDNKDVEWSLKNKAIHLLILQTGELSETDIQYIHRLRQTGYGYPVLALTDSFGDMQVDSISEKYKMYFLERPFELKTLRGLTRKLMVSKSVPQQIFKRFRTNVTATLETFISGERFESYMFNLSRGGAYFEFTKRPNLMIGDLMRLKVSLNDVERTHSVHGRVVWTTHKGHSAGGYGLGIKFMKGSDIYRNLLEKV